MNKQLILQEQKKDSTRTFRKVLVVVGVVLIVPVVLLGIIVSSGYVEPHHPTVGDAMNAAGQYYQAIKRRDYATAYHYLARNATLTVHGHPVVINSVDTLATTSHGLDTQDGMMSSYTATDGNFEQGKNIVDLTMQVTRAGRSSVVHLKLEVVSGNWTILNADGV